MVAFIQLTLFSSPPQVSQKINQVFLKNEDLYLNHKFSTNISTGDSEKDMKRNETRETKQILVKLTTVFLVWTIILTVLIFPYDSAQAATNTNTKPLEQLYKRSAPQFDLNAARNLQNLRKATGEQLEALKQLEGGGERIEYAGSLERFRRIASTYFTISPASLSRNAGRSGTRIFSAERFGFRSFRFERRQLFSAREALGGISFVSSNI
jgi:hypothetical protein